MRHSKRSLEGEILIDHQASPGLEPEIALWMGVDPRLVAKGQVVEAAILNCGHCSQAQIKNPQRTRPRGWCAKCDHYLCDACEAQMHLTLQCRNVKRRIETVANELERGTSPLLLNNL